MESITFASSNFFICQNLTRETDFCCCKYCIKIWHNKSFRKCTVRSCCRGFVLTIHRLQNFSLGIRNQSDHYIKKACSYRIIFSINFCPKIKLKIVPKYITHKSYIRRFNFLALSFCFSKVSLRYFSTQMTEFL